MTENDKAAIIEVLNMYAFALDARQFDLFDRMFTQDVVAEFGPAGTAWTNIEDFKQGFADFHLTLDSHQHTMMGHLVHISGDTAHSFSYGNWLLIREAAPGGSTWSGTGWYDDELVRTEGGWRIKHRVCKLQSWSGNPLVPEPNGDQNPDMKLNRLHSFAESGKLGFLDAIK
ncbi:nuclear transport factor 2 family protein [Arthrobacter psychrochitiniphilus]|uniref:nuclear transport factor 2 family protein n=1 Tax=Arthrobacter psychrochitiniphilus TaxID=291045 RepID=UPI003F7C96CD